jgi:hypothetical protein
MQSLVVTNSGFLSLIARFLPSQTIKRSSDGKSGGNKKFLDEISRPQARNLMSLPLLRRMAKENWRQK